MVIELPTGKPTVHKENFENYFQIVGEFRKSKIYRISSCVSLVNRTSPSKVAGKLRNMSR